jgi:hypothetical protein
MKYPYTINNQSHRDDSALGLRYIAIVLVVFSVMVATSLVLVFSARGMAPTSQASESTRFLYYLMERKRQASRNIQNWGPAIVVLGGSSPLFSVRAAQIERELGVPSVNWGIQAGLGLDYLLFNARHVLRPGDVAILLLEYDHYVQTDPQWTLADYVIPYDSAYLQSLGTRDVLSVIQKLTTTEYLRRMIDRVPQDPTVGATILESINDNGDLIANHAIDQKDYHRQSLNRLEALQLSTVRQEQFDKIKTFVAWCRSQDIQVVAGYPPFLDFPLYHTGPATLFFSTIENFYRQIGVRTLGVPTDYFFAKSMFFDTRYHMNAEGAKEMSKKISSRLAELPWTAQMAAVTAAVPSRAEAAKNVQTAVDFSAVGYPGILDKVEGLAGREAWGRWTVGSRAVFHFATTLPRRLTLEIAVNSAFAPNADKPITVRIGTVEKYFTVPEKGDTVRISFDLESDATRIELIPPCPISPNDLGLGQDTRRLGIGLKSIRILSRES